jgi:hypothetical protein
MKKLASISKYAFGFPTEMDASYQNVTQSDSYPTDAQVMTTRAKNAYDDAKFLTKNTAPAPGNIFKTKKGHDTWVTLGGRGLVSAAGGLAAGVADAASGMASLALAPTGTLEGFNNTLNGNHFTDPGVSGQVSEALFLPGMGVNYLTDKYGLNSANLPVQGDNIWRANDTALRLPSYVAGTLLGPTGVLRGGQSLARVATSKVRNPNIRFSAALSNEAESIGNDLAKHFVDPNGKEIRWIDAREGVNKETLPKNFRSYTVQEDGKQTGLMSGSPTSGDTHLIKRFKYFAKPEAGLPEGLDTTIWDAYYDGVPIPQALQQAGYKFPNPGESAAFFTPSGGTLDYVTNTMPSGIRFDTKSPIKVLSDKIPMVDVAPEEFIAKHTLGPVKTIRDSSGGVKSVAVPSPGGQANYNTAYSRKNIGKFMLDNLQKTETGETRSFYDMLQEYKKLEWDAARIFRSNQLTEKLKGVSEGVPYSELTIPRSKTLEPEVKHFVPSEDYQTYYPLHIKKPFDDNKIKSYVIPRASSTYNNVTREPVEK